MKANAPEKIYLQENTTTDCYGEWWPEWFEARAKDDDIEYTRTDAFIEKAARYLNCRLYDRVEVVNFGTVLESIMLREEFVNEFRKYMKGE